MRYVRFVLLVTVLCVCILLALSIPFNKGYELYYAKEYARLSEILKGKSRHDVVFIGSSRTLYHVNPMVVDSVTKLNTFNAGVPGANILETKMLLDAYLHAHPKPKVVVLDIHRSSFSISDRAFWNPTNYYPFLDNPAIFNGLKPFQHVYLIKHLPFFRFLEADDVSKEHSILAYFKKDHRDTTNTYKGYIPYSNDTIPLPFKRMYGTNTYPLEPEGLQLLDEIIATCKKNDIHLLMTFAPVFDPKNDPINPQFFPTLQQYSKKYNVPFLNFKTEQICNDHKMFREELHLNNTGADIYSGILAKNICKFLLEKETLALNN